MKTHASPRLALALLAAAMTFAAGAHAQDTAPPPTMDTVLVTGEQPGPGLWKVSKDDHVVWILGTWAPLPRDMTWRPSEAEARIAESQEVLTAPQAQLQISFFRKLTLLPSLVGARKDAQKRKLDEILTPELYARWSAMKTRYIGRNDRVESQRPLFAAGTLYRKALTNSGLTMKNNAMDVVEELAKKNHVKLREVKVDIPVDDPRGVIREFKSTGGEADIACLTATMDRIDSDLPAMKKRANAWANGDLQGLHDLPFTDNIEACINGVAQSPDLRQRMSEARTLIGEEWVKAVEGALARNASTFAVAPMSELLKSNGWLAALRAKGYTVEDPE